MKLAATIALLGILFLPFAFLYQGWSVELYQHRKAVKAHLLAHTPDEELVTLTFTKDEADRLHWEHAEEFQHKDEWYDIVRTDTIGDTLVYHCWWDHEETQLYQQLEALLAQHFGSTTPDSPQEIQCQQLLQHYFFSFQEKAQCNTPTISVISIANSIEANLHFTIPPTPPPNVHAFCS